METMYGQYNLMSHKGLRAQGFTHAFNNINYQGNYTQYMLHYTYNMHKLNVRFHQRHKYVHKITCSKMKTLKMYGS